MLEPSVDGFKPESLSQFEDREVTSRSSGEGGTEGGACAGTLKGHESP